MLVQVPIISQKGHSISILSVCFCSRPWQYCQSNQSEHLNIEIAQHQFLAEPSTEHQRIFTLNYKVLPSSLSSSHDFLIPCSLFSILRIFFPWTCQNHPYYWLLHQLLPMSKHSSCDSKYFQFREFFLKTLPKVVVSCHLSLSHLLFYFHHRHPYPFKWSGLIYFHVYCLSLLQAPTYSWLPKLCWCFSLLYFQNSKECLLDSECAQ